MTIKNKVRLTLSALAVLSLSQCQKTNEPDTVPEGSKIGVLIVSHGSHSKNWREMLFDQEKQVSPELLGDKKIHGIKTAFMEYTEPSIASQLKAFDKEGYSDVIVVPMLLAVSSHSFDDIPVIAGQRESVSTEEQLRLEKIEIYKPKAKLHMTPLLDFPSALENNVLRRVRAMSKDSTNEGVVLVGYGSTPYNKEWEVMMDRLSKSIEKETGINEVQFSWCGHIVHYSKKPTEDAINKVHAKKQQALVLPVLVAVDDNFQGRIIGGAINNVNKEGRIAYRHDAILPDSDITQWIKDISKEYTAKITGAENTQPNN